MSIVSLAVAKEGDNDRLGDLLVMVGLGPNLW